MIYVLDEKRKAWVKEPRGFLRHDGEFIPQPVHRMNPSLRAFLRMPHHGFIGSVATTVRILIDEPVDPADTAESRRLARNVYRAWKRAQARLHGEVVFNSLKGSDHATEMILPLEWVREAQ